MAEGITDLTGQPVGVDPAEAEKINQQFAKAMSDPDPSEKQAPPKRAEKAAGAPAGAERPRVKRGPGRPPKAASAPSAAPRSGLSHDARKQGAQGIVQLGAAGCLLAEKGTGDKAYRADAITLANSAEELGEALAATADADERFARVLDKMCAAGPYSALISVAFTVGGQIARNHKPALAMPGTQDPADLIAMAEANAPAQP